MFSRCDGGLFSYPCGTGGNGIPGAWAQIGKGPTVLADNATATVLTFNKPDGDSVFPTVSPRDGTMTFSVNFSNVANTGNNAMRYDFFKEAASGDHSLRMRQRSGAVQTIDWAVFRVTPQ